MGKDQSSRIGSVEELAGALRIAAELEHGLCCQYLFAAFTLRRTLEDFAGVSAGEDAKRHVMALTQAWATQILTVARQEMEHLAIVINLQSALGEPPHLARPNFPVPLGTYPIKAHFCLERLEGTTLERFLYYERPDYLAEELQFDDPGCCEGKALRNAQPLALPSHAGLRFSSVQELYQTLAGAYSGPDELGAAVLFRGSASAQVQSSAVQWGQSVNVPPVTNRLDAIAAIDQVTFEGEGIGQTPTSPSSHFVRFAEVNRSYVELRRTLPDLDPALPVVCNPAVSGEAPEGSQRITDPAAVRALRLFNDGYFLMLAMLRGFFEGYRGNFGTYPTFAGAAPNSALFLEAYYPFMTMFIRPLGELVCRLPAGPEHPGKNAGPGFELTEEPPGLKDLDWYEGRFAQLDDAGRELHAWLADHEGTYGADAVLAALRQSQALHRMRLNLPRLWKEGVLNP
ncbi:MAG TPA: ferritin-like domain-containing protein [Thermoanaerobaculia bacterium]|nr:ferritin-like domain-containing protein [Thermoanaerobaculia bacterium]